VGFKHKSPSLVNRHLSHCSISSSNFEFRLYVDGQYAVWIWQLFDSLMWVRNSQPKGVAADIETALTKNDRPCTVTVCIDLRSRMHATWPTIMQSRLTYTQIQQSGLALPSSSPSVIIVVVVVVNFPQRPSEAFLRLSAVLIRRRRESRVVGTYGTRYFRLYRHTYYARKFCEYCSTPTYKH